MQQMARSLIVSRPLRCMGVAAAIGGASAAGLLQTFDRNGVATGSAVAATSAAVLEAVSVDAPNLREAARPTLAAATEAGSSVAWDLPNLDHERVDYFVEMFTTRKRDDFGRFMERMGHYAPMISAKLEARGMPQDLIYLAMIESGFNPKAYSHAHASGMWQFIAETGRRYGLEVNRAIDERNDPVKATDAALDYLEDLHEQFGSWYLAAAAYNSGEGRVARVMREVTGSVRGDEYSYYRIRSRLPRETRDYVPLMVAAARIAKEPAKYGFDEVDPGVPLRYDVVEVPPATTLASIAAAAGVSVDDIRTLNPQLKIARTRNDQADRVRIPEGTASTFASARDRLEEAEPEPSFRRYRVRRGDNLIRIARNHGTSVAAIKRANGMSGSRIYAGRTILIPA